MRQQGPFLLVLVCAAGAVGAYLQALHFQFVSDDINYLTSNSKLLGLHFSEIWRIFSEPFNEFEFLPLRDLSYWIDIKLFGLNPVALRLNNIFIYLLCMMLVYASTVGLWRYFRPTDRSARWASATVTALFAIHPAHVEAVVWISGRKDLLSGLFSLLALWFAMRAKREIDLSPKYALLALFAFVGAMLSKATAVVIAPLIALLWIMYWRDNQKFSKSLSTLLWPFAILLVAVGMALVFAANSVDTVKAPVYFGVEVVPRALAILGWMVRLSFSPESRHFVYPVLDVPYLPVMIVCGVIVILAALAGFISIKHNRSLAGFSMLGFLLLSLPYTQLSPFFTTSLVSDRFLFLAVWPALLLLVVLAWHLNPLPRTILLVIIALPWGFQTIDRTNDWRSFGNIIDSDLRGFPGYYMPVMYKVGNIELMQDKFSDALVTANTIKDPWFRNIMVEIVQVDYVVRVKTKATNNSQEAVEALWKLGHDLKQPPTQVLWNLPADVFWTRSQKTFKNEWEFLLRERPDDALLRYSYGLWKLESNNYSDASTNLRAAIDSHLLPRSVLGTAYRDLGVALLKIGDAAEAQIQLKFSLEQSPPDMSAYCFLSEAYKMTGRLDLAKDAALKCPGQVVTQQLH